MNLRIHSGILSVATVFESYVLNWYAIATFPLASARSARPGR